MAKVIYEFDVYEDSDVVKRFHFVDQMYSSLLEVDQSLRNRMKHGPEMSDEQYHYYDGLRDLCHVIHAMER